MPGYSKHRYSQKRMAHVTFSCCIDRAAAFKKTFWGFREQIASLQAYEEVKDGVGAVPTRVGSRAPRPSLRATAGAPGCGKTYFLDELAAMCPHVVGEHCPETLRPWFDRANVLAVNITFNGDTPFNFDIEKMKTKGAVLSIASRILYR